MDTEFERYLESILSKAGGEGCPPKLAAAMRYSVFPGGARIRPKICLGVFKAVGGTRNKLAFGAAAAVELLHCASLVHDDLPCFDDATERRGKPSVHCAYGERIAVLVGDAMIVLAFETLVRAGVSEQNLPDLVAILSAGVGAPSGICAGQAWECESEIDLSRYHQSKTGALFIASAKAGAAAGDADPAQWIRLGSAIGEAYQVADDIHDVITESQVAGKPNGQDALHGRPNAVEALGLEGAVRRVKSLLTEGVDSIPPCPGREQLIELMLEHSKNFLPSALGQQAA